MPFSCRCGDEILYSEELSTGQWEDLKLRVLKGVVTLALPCCKGRATLRSGSVRRQHFAHFRGEGCMSDAWSDYSGRRSPRKGKSESLDHGRVKEIIKEIAEKEGWVAETEYAGSSSSGDRWVADVLAVKGEYKIAFEIQLSPQQFAYYRTRQQRYRESGIKCLWLSTTIPQLSDQEIPIFGISRSGGVFVVDFPDFFQPDILKLPVGFTGASLGEFVHLMLERAVLWEPEWVKKT